MSETLYPKDAAKERAAKREQVTKDLAVDYVRTFDSDHGRRVLADLETKFGLDRLVFTRNDRGQIDVNGGLLTDGERRVMLEVRNALKLGGFKFSNP